MKSALDHLQKPHEYRGGRVKKIMAEKRGILARINYEKKESKRYTDAIHIDAEKVYSDSFVLTQEAKENKGKPTIIFIFIQWNTLLMHMTYFF